MQGSLSPTAEDSRTGRHLREDCPYRHGRGKGRDRNHRARNPCYDTWCVPLHSSQKRAHAKTCPSWLAGEVYVPFYTGSFNPNLMGLNLARTFQECHGFPPSDRPRIAWSNHSTQLPPPSPAVPQDGWNDVCRYSTSKACSSGRSSRLLALQACCRFNGRRGGECRKSELQCQVLGTLAITKRHLAYSFLCEW